MTFRTTVDMRSLGKTEYEYVQTDDTKYIFCGTPLVYEDIFYNFVLEVADKFGYDIDWKSDNDNLSELRDKFIDAFEKVMGAKFINVCNTY